MHTFTHDIYHPLSLAITIAVKKLSFQYTYLSRTEKGISTYSKIGFIVQNATVLTDFKNTALG